eukprot:CAMPEP_0117049132 /NCGR_PEP_ID=MMETSP0472-20121206/33956_1 /TAXON_ID=693140 ORGANISM="Tiarina fusus, Strain LIS" /NCGR_SAMPLE_ID=MMETSP0472 /ASSEMBLY_ACC=CAM_ASM_000603 /LENGTH=192 /DNA_ID=CAMNT_0004762483 /DNA_START=36 /DNA_END=611 /DNA_ORIENTATION=+
MLPIIIGDPNDTVNIARFKSQYNMKFETDDWYVQKKPKEKEEETEPRRQPNGHSYRSNYKPPPAAGENTWYMFCESTKKYFKETIETQDSQYYFLVKHDTHFEAFPVSEQHTFNPVPKPHLNETDEQRRQQKRAADERRKKNERVFKRFAEVTSSLDTKERIVDNLVDDKAESMDYEHNNSDDEGIQLVTEV